MQNNHTYSQKFISRGKTIESLQNINTVLYHFALSVASDQWDEETMREEAKNTLKIAERLREIPCQKPGVEQEAEFKEVLK